MGVVLALGALDTALVTRLRNNFNNRKSVFVIARSPVGAGRRGNPTWDCFAEFILSTGEGLAMTLV